MKKAIIIHVAKMTLAAGAFAAALTGCCMFGSKGCCQQKSCCGKDMCCKSPCCESKSCCEAKSSGMNTSMTVGLGTDGVHAGGNANVGSHGVSGGVGGAMH